MFAAVLDSSRFLEAHPAAAPSLPRRKRLLEQYVCSWLAYPFIRFEFRGFGRGRFSLMQPGAHALHPGNVRVVWGSDPEPVKRKSARYYWRRGASIHPFMHFDMAIAKGNAARPIMIRTRHVCPCIGWRIGRLESSHVGVKIAPIDGILPF